jgi:GNAT superfamily N-acetyltransferase
LAAHYGSSDKMTLKLTWATLKDEAAFRDLWQQYLVFYYVTLAPDVTQATWNRILDPTSRVKARMASWNGEMIGFAVHHHHDSTWINGSDGYLEDLFVKETQRGIGAGRALIDDLITICRERGWKRLYWQTSENNSRARKLYDSYTLSDDHVRYRLDI